MSPALRTQHAPLDSGLPAAESNKPRMHKLSLNDRGPWRAAAYPYFGILLVLPCALCAACGVRVPAAAGVLSAEMLVKNRLLKTYQSVFVGASHCHGFGSGCQWSDAERKATSVMQMRLHGPYGMEWQATSGLTGLDTPCR